MMKCVLTFNFHFFLHRLLICWREWHTKQQEYIDCYPAVCSPNAMLKVTSITCLSVYHTVSCLVIVTVLL